MGKEKATHCRDCGEELTELNLVFRKWKGVTRQGNRCRKCLYIYNNEYQKERRATNPEFRKKLNDSIRKNLLKTYYDITPELYHQLSDLQLNGCAICKQKDDRGLSVDHDHKTGKVRGLLCKHCNMALGNLKEDEDLVWALLEYLKSNGYVDQIEAIKNSTFTLRDRGGKSWQVAY